MIPALVVAEATYFVGRRLGARAEAAFLRGLQTLDIEGPAPEDFARMAELVETYADFRSGGTDASVIALGERLEAAIVVTLDRRHFAAIKPRHRDAFELSPEPDPPRQPVRADFNSGATTAARVRRGSSRIARSDP